MEQVAKAQHQHQGDGGSQHQAQDRTARATDPAGQEHRQLEDHVGRHGLGETAQVGRLEAGVAAAHAGERRKCDAGGGAVHDRLDDRRGEDEREPEAAVDLVEVAQRAEQRPVDDDGLGSGVRRTGGDPEGERVDEVVEGRSPREQHRADLLEDLRDDRHEEAEHEEPGPADAVQAGTRTDGGAAVVQQAVPHPGEPHTERGGQAERAEGDSDRLVVPLVHVVEVDRVDDGDQQRRRDEGEGEVAQGARDHRNQQAQGERPPVGLGGRAARHRQQRGDQVEGHDGLALLERIARPPAPALTRGQLRTGHRVEARSGKAQHGGCARLGPGTGLVVGGGGHLRPPG